MTKSFAKGAGVLLLLTLAPRLIRSPFDGLILGAFVGLGFQISENISYAWIGAANSFGDLGATWSTIIARTLASIPSHWMYTGIFGAGLIWFIGRPEVPARKGLGAGLMLSAMVMHGLWDASAAIAGDNAISIVPGIVAFTLIGVFVWVYDNSASTEREWMRELMAPEVKVGVVTPDELDALAGSRSTLKTYVRSQPSRRTARRVLEPRPILRTRSRATVPPRPPRFSRPARRWRRRAPSESPLSRPTAMRESARRRGGSRRGTPRVCHGATVRRAASGRARRAT